MNFRISALTAWLPKTLHGKTAMWHKVGAGFYFLLTVAIFTVLVLGDMLSGSWPLVAMAAAPMLLHVILAFGAGRGSRWARIGSIFAGISLLFAFPIGTPFGVLILMSSLPRWSVAPADVPGA